MERVQAADEGILFWFEGGQDRPWLHKAMEIFTFLGNRWTVIAVILIAVLLFWLAGRRRTACIVLAASVLGFGIAQAVKYMVKRPRPDVVWRQGRLPTEPSFPSGHSLNSMAIYGSIALAASRSVRRRLLRWLVIALGLGLPVLIGLSRPYLGFHYPTDVLAGWTAGLACALLAYWADQRWTGREVPLSTA
jgi:undecaprenyl-diphosphatase